MRRRSVFLRAVKDGEHRSDVSVGFILRGGIPKFKKNERFINNILNKITLHVTNSVREHILDEGILEGDMNNQQIEIYGKEGGGRSYTHHTL